MNGRTWLFFLVALIWFFGVGIFYVDKQDMVHWIGTLFAYIVGGQWVFSWFFKRTMYAPYSGADLKPNGEHADIRAFLFCLGLLLMFFSSVL